MKNKFWIIGATLVSVTLITACGKNTKPSGAVDESEISGEQLTGKDVVNQKDIISSDGKEVTEYEMKDGTKIELPRDIDLNDPNKKVIMGEPEDVDGEFSEEEHK